jgi:hypothetical protein
MRSVLVAVLLLLFAATALASDTGNPYAPSSRVPPLIGVIADSRVGPPIGEPIQGKPDPVDLFLTWFRARLGMLNGYLGR